MHRINRYTQEQIQDLQAGQILDYCVFDGLVIQNAPLQETEFTNCSFSDCNLTGSKFNGATFTNCNFSSASVSGCNFFSATFVECKLMGVVLSRANSLTGVTFTKCNFDYADLRGLDLSAMDLSGGSFFETDLSLSNLSKTIFINSRVIHTKFEQASMDMTDFRGAELLGLDIRSDTFRGAIFTPQQITGMLEAIGIHVLDTQN
jgi:fluoroquinolone resistance protein